MGKGKETQQNMSMNRGIKVKGRCTALFLRRGSTGMRDNAAIEYLRTVTPPAGFVRDKVG